jgi:hypothetical protein
MKYFISLLFCISFSFASEINLGKFDKISIQKIINTNDIVKISAAFVNIPYKSNTLIGNNNTKEEFVINLSGVDCFTFIDYIESIKRSNGFEAFVDHVKTLRYHSSKPTYYSRNHFFSDWIQYNGFENISKQIAPNDYKSVVKYLNQKSKNQKYLDGISITKRIIDYIPSVYIDTNILSKINTGDYVGIYTNINGLDVTHVGILIKKNNKIYFRHASSSKKNRKVVTVDFENYIKNKIGIVVLRSK